MVAPSPNDAQDLEEIGMLTTNMGPIEVVLSEDKSRLLAIALSHIYCGAEYI